MSTTPRSLPHAPCPACGHTTPTLAGDCATCVTLAAQIREMRAALAPQRPTGLSPVPPPAPADPVALPPAVWLALLPVLAFAAAVTDQAVLKGAFLAGIGLSALAYARTVRR